MPNECDEPPWTSSIGILLWLKNKAARDTEHISRAASHFWESTPRFPGALTKRLKSLVTRRCFAAICQQLIIANLFTQSSAVRENLLSLLNLFIQLPSITSSPRTKLPQGFGKLQATSLDELHSWPLPLWSSQTSILAQSPEFGDLIIALSFRGKSSQAGVLPLLARCIHTLVLITCITDLSWTMRTIRLALVRNLLTKPGSTRSGRWESNVFHRCWALEKSPAAPAALAWQDPPCLLPISSQWMTEKPQCPRSVSLQKQQGQAQYGS